MDYQQSSVFNVIGDNMEIGIREFRFLRSGYSRNRLGQHTLQNSFGLTTKSVVQIHY